LLKKNKGFRMFLKRFMEYGFTTLLLIGIFLQTPPQSLSKIVSLYKF